MENLEREASASPDLSVGWQSGRSLGDCMLQLFEANMWTDVTFRFKDQGEDSKNCIHAHKIVLAARSPVFQAMFFGPFKDGEKEIYLDDIGSHDLNLFMKSIYSDDVGNDTDDLIAVLKIAHKYQVQYVVDKCAQVLSDCITDEYACELVDLGLTFNIKTLIDSTSKYVDENADKVLESEGFLELSKEGLLHILKGDTFFVREVRIFERAMEWAKTKSGSDDGQTLRCTLGDAFFYLRTPTMTTSEFVLSTRRKGFYSLPETEDIMVAIEGLSSTEEVIDLCNSARKRIKPEFELDLVYGCGFGFGFNVQETVMSMYLQFRPKSAMYLKGFVLNRAIEGNFKNNRNYTACDMTSFNIKVTATLQKCNLEYNTEVCWKRSPFEIKFKKPVLVEAIEDWYTLIVTIKTLDNYMLHLKAHSVNDVASNEPKIFEAQVQSGKSSFKLVKSLMFENLSHRY